MSGKKALLIETLLSLSTNEKIETLGYEEGDYLKACFLLLSSHSIEACTLAERLGFETFDDDSTGTRTKIKGLSLPESNLLVIDVIEGLMDISPMPEQLSKILPNLNKNDYRAALYAIRCILYSLQWNEWDSNREKKYSKDAVAKLVEKSIDQIISFRETGEP